MNELQEHTGIVAVLAAVGGGVITWTLRILAGNVFEKKNKLESEKIDSILAGINSLKTEMKSEFKDVRTELELLSRNDTVKTEKISVANRRIGKLEDEVKEINKQITSIRLNISERHPK